MNRDEAVKTLNRRQSTRAELRGALAFALGVDYIPQDRDAHGSASLFILCRDVFMEYYRAQTGIDYVFTPADARALKELLGKIEAISKDSENIRPTFEVFLHRLPEWYKENALSLGVINRKFNEIVTAIKKNHGRSASTPGISDDYRRRILDDLQS